MPLFTSDFQSSFTCGDKLRRQPVDTSYQNFTAAFIIFSQILRRRRQSFGLENASMNFVLLLSNPIDLHLFSPRNIYKYRNRFKGFCDRDAIYCQNKKWLFPLFLFEILSKGRMWWRRCLLLPFGCQESKVSYNFRADISIPSMYIVHHLFYICPRSSKRKEKTASHLGDFDLEHFHRVGKREVYIWLWPPHRHPPNSYRLLDDWTAVLNAQENGMFFDFPSVKSKTPNGWWSMPPGGW